MRKRVIAVPLIAVAVVSGCATVPTGPSVMVLPGSGKPFEVFQADDDVCRGWAMRQTGGTPSDSATSTTIGGSAIGTLLGAALGAAIGAAAGNPAMGAAVGAGSGLAFGTVAGASAGSAAGMTLQQRYDASYQQCMYAKGNQIPSVAQSPRRNGYVEPPPPPPPPPASAPAPPPPPAAASPAPPPPPPGPPPPPPPR